jgi:Ca-activated chloride channel family protein
MTPRVACIVLVVTCTALTAPAWGQGFIICPEPLPPVLPRPCAVNAHQVDVQIDDQIARVQVRQTFNNPGPQALEAEYLFPLPADGVVQDFVLTVDGREIPGKVLDREEARRFYENIVRRRKDPALLEYMGRGLFKTSVFPIPPGKDSQVSLGYNEVLGRNGDLVTFAYPLGAAGPCRQPVSELRIAGQIRGSRAISSVYSPTHSVQVQRPSETTARFEFRQTQACPQGDFRLLYNMADEDVGLALLSYRPSTAEAGYFLMLASPKLGPAGAAILPKTIVFVMDKSGSMTGQKLEQAKSSLRFVLRNLNRDDTFNIVTYDSVVAVFKPELQRGDPATVAEALQFVDTISAGGSTDIDGALRTAMGLLTADGRPAYVLFMTDGLPTAGEQRVAAIVENCRRANGVRARLMGFGVGDDVNAHLLDKLVAENFGASHYVRPNADIEEPISRLYSQLSAPVLSEVSLDFPGLDRGLSYPQVLPDVFRGSQLLVVGRYHEGGPVDVTLRGRSGDGTQAFGHHAVLDQDRAAYACAFVEKLWAHRRVGWLIDQIDLHGPNQELVDEIVRLSTRHGILTPYTSFLADGQVQLGDSRNVRRAHDQLEKLRISSGREGVGQREGKAAYMQHAAAPEVGMAMSCDMQGNFSEVQTVYNLGTKTFYNKEGRWKDSTVGAAQEGAAIRVVRFSADYFDLASRLAPFETQYLALNGEIVVDVGGQTYLIAD